MKLQTSMKEHYIQVGAVAVVGAKSMAPITKQRNMSPMHPKRWALRRLSHLMAHHEAHIPMKPIEVRPRFMLKASEVANCHVL